MKLSTLNDTQRRRIARLYDLSRTGDLHLQDIAEMESSEELHQLAYLPGWSNPLYCVEIAHAIVNHPLCDFGTALQVYWRLEYSWCTLQYLSKDAITSPDQRRVFDEMFFIEGKLASQDFCSRKIAVVSRECFKSTGSHRAPIIRSIPDILFQDSPGTACPQDDLEIELTHEEWRDLIRVDLDSTIMCLTSDVEKDPEFQPYLDWFVRRNIEGDLCPFTNRIARFQFNRLKSSLQKSWESVFTSECSAKNPHLSDDQRRRLHRILETIIPGEDHVQFVHQMESAEELHQLTVCLNWDDRHADEILLAILNHPHCDYGTALLIYWGAGVTYYRERYCSREEVEEFNLAGYDFLELVEHRLLEDRFASHRIQVDVNEWWNREKLEQGNFKRPLLPKLFRNSPGTPFIRDDLQYEFNDRDRYLSVLDHVCYTHYQIEAKNRENPLFKSVAARFREINLDGRKLKDFPFDPTLVEE